MAGFLQRIWGRGEGVGVLANWGQGERQYFEKRDEKLWKIEELKKEEEKVGG